MKLLNKNHQSSGWGVGGGSTPTPAGSVQVLNDDICISCSSMLKFGLSYRSGENHAVMKKTFWYLIFMVIILPTFGFTSGQVTATSYLFPVVIWLHPPSLSRTCLRIVLREVRRIKREVRKVVTAVGSAADPGCLFQIQIFPSRIQGRNDSRSGSAPKNLSIFNPKIIL
jgi:hypothetical protein